TTSSDALDEESLEMLNNYVQGVYDADAAYGEIVNYFKNVDEPTVIVMFGDHLPGLGEDYQVYRDLGFIDTDDLEGDDYIEVLDRCGFTLPSYWAFLLDQQQDFSQNNFVTVNSDGTLTEGISAETEKFNQEQWLIEYDILFGDGYFENVN
ncbi:MAG: hypothetical protein PWP20_712, partial [Eubacteriaceae bacterium]|nr:hypothetical protein [Eubacteriaceae bacterium]